MNALRKRIVEPVFGQIKGARGLDRFRLRGLEKVNGEWALMPRLTTFSSCSGHRSQRPEVLVPIATAARHCCDQVVQYPRSSITTAWPRRNVRHAPSRLCR
jgi:hypothetical protein